LVYVRKSKLATGLGTRDATTENCVYKDTFNTYFYNVSFKKIILFHIF
jgi:hypothetical protein